MEEKTDLLRWIDSNQDRFIRISDEIWENPETALKEVKAAALQASYLEGEGFRIRWGAGGLATAFIAEWGVGRPVIGFLGEYDALKNLSQKRAPFQDPLVPGGAGHGCGHNLLGTAALAAAAAIRHWLEASGSPGVVRYYGCPAEEVLIGKVYMARAGAFDDLDAAFNFHPNAVNTPFKGSYVALNNLKFRFHGKASHAGSTPHLGRSALDGVELMNVGVNYLREHVETTSRIHYVITHGGDAPNIVPSDAEVWYYVRAPTRPQVDEITNRIRKIAQGAALMTETSVEEIFITGCYNVLSNHTLADVQFRAMREIGPISFTGEEMEFARLVNACFPGETRRGMLHAYHLPANYEDEPLFAENFPPLNEQYLETGSTDVGDVSWITPLSMLYTTCFPACTAPHTWGVTAASGMSIGHKGMLHAARIMALAAYDLFRDPELLKRVRAEFEQAVRANPYRSPLPESAQIPPDE